MSTYFFVVRLHNREARKLERLIRAERRVQRLVGIGVSPGMLWQAEANEAGSSEIVAAACALAHRLCRCRAKPFTTVAERA